MNLSTNVQLEFGDEATKEERRSEANNALCQTFKLIEIIIDSTMLSKFEQGSFGVIIERRRKSGFESLEQARPQHDEAVAKHPLKLA